LAPIVLIAFGAARRLDDATVEWRWQTFARGLDLVRSEDTRYQNLAIGRLGDQYSLYTSGLVAATWPNHTDLAIEAHLAACECPSPRRILVLGGGAEGILKELLRYKPARLDYVTLDPRLLEMERPHLDRPDQEALAALGDHVHFMDARRFVMRAAAPAGRMAEDAERYDLVILAAPEPASALEARLYTPEFFAAVAAILSDDGVLATSLTGTVGYWGAEPAAYVASVVLPLKRVFPEVLLTFGLPTRCYAAKRAGVLAETGEVLAARYRRAGVASPYFDPLWFAGASDLLDPAKRASVERAILGREPPLLNTDERPAAALHHMRFWLATSEAGHGGGGAPAAQRTDLLGALMGLRIEWTMLAAVGATVLAALVGLVRGRRGLRRAALLWSVGTTGLATMALEIVLLYTFQTLYGYVYSMVGLVVGVFMFGLVLGSLAMNRWLRGGGLIHSRGGSPHPPRQNASGCAVGSETHRANIPAQGGQGLQALAWLDLVMAIFAAGLVIALGALRGSAADWPIQAATFALVAVTGVLGGLVFPLAAAVALETSPSTARAAGAIDAADCIGACIGGLATGVILVPVLGVSGACWAMAGAKALSALLVGSAAATSRRGPAGTFPGA
jgi:spermidine synthase